MPGSALLTAYKNAGGDINLEDALMEMQSRGKSVPGGACGFWGACGAGISTGMFVSIITKASPLTQESWGLSNLRDIHADMEDVITNKSIGQWSERGKSYDEKNNSNYCRCNTGSFRNNSNFPDGITL